MTQYCDQYFDPILILTQPHSGFIAPCWQMTAQQFRNLFDFGVDFWCGGVCHVLEGSGAGSGGEALQPGRYILRGETFLDAHIRLHVVEQTSSTPTASIRG